MAGSRNGNHDFFGVVFVPNAKDWAIQNLRGPVTVTEVNGQKTTYVHVKVGV